MDGTGLQFGLLGTFTASRDGEPLDLGGRRQRAVLALLVLANGEVVPGERLAGSLWGESPPGDTAGALQAYVSHLRRRLQPGAAARNRSAVIVSEGRGYAVRLPRDAVDAWRFEDLLQRAEAAGDPRQVADLLGTALGLWRGPALAEYADEDWAEPVIARLTELRAVARERLLAVAGHGSGSPQILLEVRALGGAYAREARYPNAFSHRAARFSVLSVGMMPDEAVPAHTQRVFDALADWDTGGCWPNFGPAIDAASARRAYDPDTLARLQAVVEKYDPDGVLRLGTWTREA